MNPLRRINDAVETWKGPDALAERLQNALEPVFSKPAVENALSGRWLTHAVHPLLITLPIGAWTTASLFDLMGDDRAAKQLIVMGTVAAGPSVATGLSDWQQTDGAARRVGLVHASANSVTLALYAVSFGLRASGRRRAGVVTSVLGAGAMAVSGYLGGHMSYAMGVGVDREPHSESAPFAGD